MHSRFENVRLLVLPIGTCQVLPAKPWQDLAQHAQQGWKRNLLVLCDGSARFCLQDQGGTQAQHAQQDLAAAVAEC